MEAFGAAVAYLSLKAGTIVAAGIMATLGFFLDSRKHSWPTAVLAILSGVAMAVVFTDTVADYLHMPDTYKNAIAGVLGISGRNTIIVISKLSRDPGYLLRIWRGERDE